MNHPDNSTAHYASKSTINLLKNPGRLFSLLLLLSLSAVSLFWTIPLHAGRPALPAAPSNLAATTVSSTQINLSWRDNSGNESGFTIERSISASGPWLQIASTAINATSYSNSGLGAATTYYYRVYAYNSRGSSSYSSVASATTAQGSVPSCTYAISPASASFPSDGGNGSSSVAASSGCAWTATSGATWITLTAGASGTGSGTTTFNVAANTSASSRTGTMTIAGQTFTVSQAAAAATGPANDFCANGIVASASSATLTGSNIGATKEVGEPNHAGIPGGKSVWWSWNAPSAGSVTINTFGSGFDTLLGVYTGTSVSALTAVASNDDSGGMQSSVTFNAVAGTTYQIAVDGYAAASGNVTLSLSQTTTACTYSISPASTNPGSGAGSGTVTVTAGAGCAWTATSSATSWLTCTPASGTGNGTVTWSATANTSTSSRTGTLTIGGQTFTVTQSGVACTYSISSTSANPGAATASGSVNVTALAGCGWTASSSATSWLTCTPASGTGNGTVTWSATANTSTSSRTGTLTIGGQAFTVTQSGVSCTYSISSTSANPGAAAASGSVNVTALAGCSWTASSSATSWLTCTPAGGSGNGTVTWTVTANTSTSSRTGTLTIGGQTFTVTQSGVACTYSISSTSASPGSSAASGSVNVTALAGCSWTASSGATSWLTCTPASGSGNGTVTWSATANTSTSSRTGTLTVAGQTFTVSQAAAAGDTTPPAVSLTAPSGGSTVSGTITLTCSASDNVGVSKVEYWCDGTDLCATATVAPFSASDDTRTMSNGSHTYRAKAFDAAGNSTTSAGSTVTVNNTTSTPAQCIWSRHFGGSVVSVDSVDAVSIKEDHNGNVVVVGRFGGTVNFGGGALTSAGSDDIFVLKYDSTGTFQWVRKFGSFSTDKATAVAIDSANNIIVVGSFNATVDFGGASFTSAGSSDMFVAKYSPNGALLWAKRFGGTAAESCNALALDGADNILITGYYGYFGTAVDFGGGPLPLPGGSSAMVKDVFVAKLGPSGGYLWAKGYAGSGYDSGNGIAVDGNGDVLVVGSYQGSLNLGGNTLVSAGGYDAFVAKYAGATGAHQWSVSGGGSGNDQGRGVAVDASGNVFATGEFMGTATIAGNILSSAYNPAYPAIFLAKYAAAGTAAWAKAFVPMDSFSMAGGRGVAVDGAGNIVLTGYSQGTVDFGGGQYLSNGSTAVMLVKVSGSGGVTWVKGYAGAALSNYGEGISIGAGNNILVTGYFGDPIDFGCGSMTSACRADGFAAKVGP